MPLSEPAPRRHLHTRRIHLQGYIRDDGLFDIEARIEDTKTYPFHNEWRGEMTPGTPVHNMSIRVTLDDTLQVHDVEAVTDDSPFPVCPEITPNFERLKGLRIGRGWNRKVKELLGGTQGCTHLVELLAPVATVAFQTIRPYKRHQVKQTLRPDEADPTNERPFQIDTCHAWASDGPVVQRWMPQFYTGPGSEHSAPRRERTGTDE